MKFCLINNLYKPYSRGGAEKVVEMTARGLRDAGHEAFVITSSLKRRNIVEDIDDFKVYRVYSPNLVTYYNLSKLSKVFRLVWHFFDMLNFVAASEVAKIVEQEKPDAIFLHNLKGLSYLIPEFLRGNNSILVPHDTQLIIPSGMININSKFSARGGSALGGQIPDSRFSAFFNLYAKINKKLFSSIQAIVSPSKWLLDFYESHGFFKNATKVVLPNPAPNIQTTSSESRVSSRQLNLLFVGQLEDSKGILFLIDVLKNYKLTAISYKLFIVGDGNKHTEVEKLIFGDSRFQYLGKLNGETLQNEYQKADFTIVSSLVHENCPTVILESFSAGTSVIASRSGGIPELIKDGINGFLFEAGNSESFIQTLNKAQESNWQELSHNAKIVAEALSLKNYVNRLIEAVNGGKNEVERNTSSLR